MAHSSWGPGYPSCDRGRVVTLKRSDGLRLPVHEGLVDLVSMLMDLTELAGYDVKPGETWGYACRAIRGSTRPSNHSWGTAVDINAPSNPMGSVLVTDIPVAVRSLWKSHGFGWGGDYRSRPDAMHFEFLGTLTDAALTADRLRRYLGHTTPPPSAPGRPAARPYPGVVRMGDRGATVRVWQQVLVERGYRITVDGVFGPATNHVVVDWQRKHRLAADGVAGPATWHSLLYA